VEADRDLVAGRDIERPGELVCYDALWTFEGATVAFAVDPGKKASGGAAIRAKVPGSRASVPIRA
jgi:hypothetical protein